MPRPRAACPPRPGDWIATVAERAEDVGLAVLACAAGCAEVAGTQVVPLGVDALILETAFMVFFLTVGGHHWLLRIIARSYDVFPIGQTPSPEAMGTAILSASVLMLTLALKLAAPILAAFLVLAVILAILSRLIPEMNVMMASFPLRMGLGMFLAAAILPSLNAFTSELADWMNRFPAT